MLKKPGNNDKQNNQEATLSHVKFPVGFKKKKWSCWSHRNIIVIAERTTTLKSLTLA